MKRKKDHREEKTPEISFRQQVEQLPVVMRQKFLQQLFAVFLISAFTIFFMIYFKAWQFCIGFLLALYIAYLAMNLVWNYNTGTIECHRMICVKATILPGRERVFLIMKDLVAKDGEQVTKQFYISTSKKKAVLFTPQTVVDIYYRPKNALDVVAWEIVGNEGGT